MADRTLTAGTGIALSEATAGQLIVSSTVSTSGLAPLASPALTGTPTAPTASAGTNTTQVATTAYVETAVASVGSGSLPAIITHGEGNGATRTFALTDAGDWVQFTNTTAVTATIPPNADVAFPVGTRVTVFQAGSAQVTIAAGAGVTLNVAPSHDAKTREQYATVEIIKRATDTWALYGNLAEAP